MNISYQDQNVRNYCSSLKYDVQNTPFNTKEIILIRAIISDLRAAPCLADAPVSYNFIHIDKTNIKITIDFEQIKIICKVVTNLSNPTSKTIKRIKIIDIKKPGLQLLDQKDISA